eukprot:Rmarinus@m.1347
MLAGLRLSQKEIPSTTTWASYLSSETPDISPTRARRQSSTSPDAKRQNRKAYLEKHLSHWRMSRGELEKDYGSVEDSPVKELDTDREMVFTSPCSPDVPDRRHYQHTDFSDRSGSPHGNPSQESVYRQRRFSPPPSPTPSKSTLTDISPETGRSLRLADADEPNHKRIPARNLDSYGAYHDFSGKNQAWGPHSNTYSPDRQSISSQEATPRFDRRHCATPDSTPPRRSMPLRNDIVEKNHEDDKQVSPSPPKPRHSESVIIRKLEQQLSDAQGEISHYRKRVAALEGEVVEAKASSVALEHQLEDAHAEVSELKREITRLKKQVLTFEEDASAAATATRGAKDAAARAEEEKTKLLGRIDSLEADIRQRADSHAKDQKTLRHFLSQYNDLRKTHATALEKQAALDSDLSKSRSDLEESRERVAELERRARSLQREKDEASKEKTWLRNQLDKVYLEQALGMPSTPNDSSPRGPFGPTHPVFSADTESVASVASKSRRKVDHHYSDGVAMALNSQGPFDSERPRDPAAGLNPTFQARPKTSHPRLAPTREDGAEMFASLSPELQQTPSVRQAPAAVGQSRQANAVGNPNDTETATGDGEAEAGGFTRNMDFDASNGSNMRQSVEDWLGETLRNPTGSLIENQRDAVVENGAIESTSIDGDRNSVHTPFSEGGASNRSRSSAPFATENSLKELLTTSAKYEDDLMRLSQRKNEIDSDLARLPVTGAKSIAQLQKRSSLEKELRLVESRIHHTRKYLRKLNVL